MELRSVAVLVCMCMYVCACLCLSLRPPLSDDAKVEGAEKMKSAFVKKQSTGRSSVKHCSCVQRKEAGSLYGCMCLLVWYTVG